MRILIADEHEVVRRGVRSLLLSAEDCHVCGEAVDGADAITKAKELNPDLIVMDIGMPRLNGIEATRQLREVLPHTDVLIMSQHDSPQMMRDALKAGARGYVVKSAMSNKLVPALDKVRRGETFFEPAVLAGVKDAADPQEMLRRSVAFEKALRESEERFRITFEQAAVGMAHVAEDGRWIRVNKKLCEIVGYMPEELLQLTFQHITHPEDLAADVAQAVKLVRGEGDEYSTEKRYIRKDGQVVWVNLTVAAVRDERRKFQYFISIVEDISARKNAEARQHKAAQQQKALFHLADELHRAESVEEVYRAAFNAIFDALQCHRAAVLLADENGTMRFVSSLGLSTEYRNVMEGHSAWKANDTNPQPICVTNIERADFGDLVKAAMKREGIAAVAFIPLVSNGKLIGNFRAYFDSAHHFPQEEIDLSLTIARQLAFGIERRRSEEALNKSETQFRELSTWLDSLRNQAEAERRKLHEMFMQAPAAIALLNGPEHRFVFVNRECLRLSGRQRIEDLVDKPLREAMPELARQGSIEMLDEAYRTGEPYIGDEMPVVLSGANGDREVYVSFVFQPVRNVYKQVEGILVHAVEVTAQVTARGFVEDSEERFRLAQAAAHVGTWEWDAADDTRTLSAELYRIFGTDPKDPRHAEKWAERVHAEDVQKVRQCMEEGYRSGQMDFEYRYNHPGLGLRWLHCKGSRVREDSRMFGVVLDVTERKQAEEALRRSERHLRAIIETTPECVKVVAPDGTLLHMNPSGLGMVGADSLEDVVGRNVYQIIAPEHRDKYREFNERICLGEKGSLEFDIVGLRGARRHMHTYAAPLRNTDGTTVQLAVTHDITERKQAEIAQYQLAAIVESSDDAIISKNLNGVIASWNAGAEQMFGFTAKEAIGQPVTMIIPAESQHEEVEILTRLRNGERITDFETIRIRKDGSRLNISLTISPIRDAEGRVIGASKIARDVTKRKQAEEKLVQAQRELQASADHLELITSRMSAAVSRVGDDLRYLWVNEAYTDWMQRAPDEIVGHQMEEVLGPAAMLKLWPHFRRVLAGEKVSYEEYVHFQDIGGRWVSTVHTPTFDAAGKPDGWVAVILDITERKLAEQALRESEERFRALANTLDAEVRARTAELIRRNAEVIEQSEELRELSSRLMRLQDEERRRIARELHDSAGQTITALNMTLGRISDEVKEKAPDLHNEIDDTLQLVQQLMREIRTTSYLLHPPLLDETGLDGALSTYVAGIGQRSDLQIKMDIADDFGRLPPDLELSIFRIVQECLTNIHRHSGSKCATIGLSRSTDGVSLEVQDDGKGISAERLAEIQSQRSGVGIRGMRERVRQFHGELKFESSAQGTKIYVYVPLDGIENPKQQNG